jgi:hypothetical protein
MDPQYYDQIQTLPEMLATYDVHVLLLETVSADPELSVHLARDGKAQKEVPKAEKGACAAVASS